MGGNTQTHTEGLNTCWDRRGAYKQGKKGREKKSRQQKMKKRLSVPNSNESKTKDIRKSLFVAYTHKHTLTYIYIILLNMI